MITGVRERRSTCACPGDRARRAGASAPVGGILSPSTALRTQSRAVVEGLRKAEGRAEGPRSARRDYLGRHRFAAECNKGSNSRLERHQSGAPWQILSPSRCAPSGRHPERVPRLGPWLRSGRVEGAPTLDPDMEEATEQPPHLILLDPSFLVYRRRRRFDLQANSAATCGRSSSITLM